MSLSRPERFPLLKLPFLCIECVIKSWDIFDIKTDHSLESCTYGMNEGTASKMVLDFLNDVFKCSVEKVRMGGKLPESGDIGVKSTVNLHIHDANGCAQLKLLLENLEVIDTCTFHVNDTNNGFYCDPKLFKCKALVFSLGSAAWVTREILMQFEVPRLTFLRCPFSVKDILSFVTHWFHSDSKKLEYLSINIQNTQISLEDFQTEQLNLVPFSGRHRVPPTFGDIDLSEGLEIVRHDGLVATIHFQGRAFLFYVCHN
ncbi:hypothetical protein CAEBREN_02752 [Caenorhabditis brenneri]|uniref:Sdz-33 F-box domain-containing protein n=1 Tax=Caenorhabditis brenneri TaxID=135651 RepID=G0NW54_CAEBE|nr:hypothetical protein CAEBREN_02752 [Caenorhabditis brenneri]